MANRRSTGILDDTWVGGWVGQNQWRLVGVIIPWVRVAINIYLSNGRGNNVAMANGGGCYPGLCVVGYSFAKHQECVRQCLHLLVHSGLKVLLGLRDRQYAGVHVIQLGLHPCHCGLHGCNAFGLVFLMSFHIQE